MFVLREGKPNKTSGYSAVGSALPWGGRGRGFKSRYSDQYKAPVGSNQSELFSLLYFGVWLSLVERLVRDQEAGGSNPLTPTRKNDSNR